MSYARLEELGGIQWPCPDEEHPGAPFLHGAPLGGAGRGPRGAVLASSSTMPPVDELDDEFPIRLTTGRRLDSYNTGRAERRLHARRCAAASRSTSRPRTPRRLRRRATARSCAVSSRRGSVEAPVRIDAGAAAGLAFMTLHFPDEVDDQPAHDRRDRPEVGHRRVQGDARSGSRSCRRRPRRRGARRDDWRTCR